MIMTIENLKRSSVNICRRTALLNKAAKHVRRRLKSIRDQLEPTDICSCHKRRFGCGSLVVPTMSPLTESESMDVTVRQNRSSSHGSLSVIGRRREMEDAVAVEPGFVDSNSTKYDFYGVYDGHGGSSVAHACRDWLHLLMAREVEEKEDKQEVNWKKVMLESFEKMDEQVMNTEGVGSIGSTAVVAVVGEKVIVVGNCGDSRVVLSRGGVSIPMSIDHKPDRADELKRIEECGGMVIEWDGQRVLGVLATSRSIGDKNLKPYVIAEPEVVVTERSNDDEFLILASDGLWDVIPNELACRVLRKSLRRKTNQGLVCSQRRTTNAATILVELAISKGSKDNISVVVVDFSKPI